MRTLASFLMVSLDGYFEAGNPEDFDWHNVDDEFNDFAVEQLDASDCLLFGRVTYQGMAGYWPTPAAIVDDPQVASRMNKTSKIVISRTLDRPDPDWNNTRLIVANVREEMSKLKEQPGKDLLVLGSSNLTASLMSMGLLDQLRIMVNPIVLVKCIGSVTRWCGPPASGWSTSTTSPAEMITRSSVWRTQTSRPAYSAGTEYQLPA